MPAVRVFLAIGMLLACAPLQAEELAIRWVDLPASALTVSEPEGLVELSQGNVHTDSRPNEIATTMTQPMKLEYSLSEEFPLHLRYLGEMRLQTLEDPFTYFNLGNRMDIAHTTAMVAEFSKNFTATLAWENHSFFPQDSQLQWSNRLEAQAKNKLFGKVDFTSAVGIAEVSDTNGTSITQRYLRLKVEHRIADSPVRVRLAPSLTEETNIAAGLPARTLTGLDSAVLLDATETTVVSLGAYYASAQGLTIDDTDAQSSLYSQIEHLATKSTTIRLRANYEEKSVRHVINTAAMVFMLDTSFSFTQTLRGGLQLQHQMREVISSQESLSETILSLSLGGSF
jgi:hypothetical protein